LACFFQPNLQKELYTNDPNELKQKKDFILSRSSLVNSLVLDDAKETWISLSLREYPKGDAKDEVMMAP